MECDLLCMCDGGFFVFVQVFFLDFWDYYYLIDFYFNYFWFQLNWR